MRLNIILLFVVLLSIFDSFSQKKELNNFTLDGTIKNDYSGYIYLKYENTLDSCLIKNNHFIFKGTIHDEIVSASITFKKKLYNLPDLYLEKAKIFIDVTLNDKKIENNQTFVSIDIINMKGSRTYAIQKEYENFISEYEDDINFKQRLLEKTESIVERNPSNPFSASIFGALTWDNNLDKSRLKKIYHLLDKTKIDKISANNIEKNLFPERHIGLINTIIDFELLDRNNLSFSCTSLKGKWILIDFWASWCLPCRKEFPELKRVYEQFKESNFEIIGVSIDKDILKWKKALDDDNLNWINVNENLSNKVKPSDSYEVNAIPTNFLINPEGKIVAKEISIEKLVEFLKGI